MKLEVGAVLTIDGSLCFYAFMRTTVELPPELMKQAKARAAAEGESLKALLTRAVASELGKSHLKESGSRIRLPVFGNPKEKTIHISGREIALALAEEDIDRSRRTR